MGFQVTAPTAVPVDGDGSQDQETWAEGAGTIATPAEEGAGLVAQVLAAATVNFNAQKSGRVSRSTMNRMVLGDEGFLSTCILSAGTFNVAGGTLNITLTPTRVVVDDDDTGGIVLEIKAPVGSPETLTALRDTYLNLNEAGAYELQVVGNGDPAPTPTAGYVAIWLLVTDGTQLDSATLISGVAPFPCLGTTSSGIGIRKAVIELPTLGGTAANAVTVTGTATFAEDAAFDGGLTVSAGQTLTANGDVTLGDAAGDSIIIPGTVTAQETLNLSKGGDLSAFTPATVGQYGRSSNGDLLYHNGDRIKAPGLRVYQSQESATGASSPNTTLQTTKRQDAPVTLMVTVTLYATRTAAGSVSFQVEQDDGVSTWSNLGNGFTEPNVGTAQTLVTFSRFVIGVDTTERRFRVVATAGASTVDIEEATLVIVPAQ